MSTRINCKRIHVLFYSLLCNKTHFDMQYALFSWKIVLNNDKTKKYELQFNNEIMIRWVSGCCEMPNGQVCRYIMVTTSYIQWDGDDVRLVLDQYDELDFGSASSLKQQTMSLLEHIILILSQPVFSLTT